MYLGHIFEEYRIDHLFIDTQHHLLTNLHLGRSVAVMSEPQYSSRHGKFLSSGKVSVFTFGKTAFLLAACHLATFLQRVDQHKEKV